jgi:hypothetical protein
LIETGESFSNETPDQVLVIGTLARGGGFTLQIEGGKRNNSGLQIDITGMGGDLKISNPLSFTNPNDNTVEGSQGDNEPLKSCLFPSATTTFPRRSWTRACSTSLISTMRSQTVVRTMPITRPISTMPSSYTS